jgi:hypothetical protein
MVRLKEKSILLVTGLLATLFCISLTACGGDEITNRAAHTSATQTATLDSSEYVSDVRDLTANADGLNSDYRDLLERYDAGDVTVEEVTGFADSAAGDFEFMTGRLNEMDVPEDLLSEHQLLVSAFSKWQQFYRMQVEGLDNNDTALLEQARDLDTRAAIEINQAIDGINQKATE